MKIDYDKLPKGWNSSDRYPIIIIDNELQYGFSDDNKIVNIRTSQDLHYELVFVANGFIHSKYLAGRTIEVRMINSTHYDVNLLKLDYICYDTIFKGLDVAKHMLVIYTKGYNAVCYCVERPESYRYELDIDKHFPLIKTEVVEKISAKDGDSQKYANVLYYLKATNDTEWKNVYSECMSIDHLCGISDTINRIKNLFDRPKITEETHNMFSWNHHMFQLMHVGSNCTVCGKTVDGSYVCDDGIKLDRVKEYIYPYENNTLVGLNHKIYLNGSLMCTYDELIEKINEKQIPVLIRYHNIDMMYPPNLSKYIKEIFPDATQYEMPNSSGPFVND